jgi:hypothetical protein
MNRVFNLVGVLTHPTARKYNHYRDRIRAECHGHSSVEEQRRGHAVCFIFCTCTFVDYQCLLHYGVLGVCVVFPEGLRIDAASDAWQERTALIGLGMGVIGGFWHPHCYLDYPVC